jgi:N-acetylglucosaminyl-diphospho-decaprenol L-rhamnosyltransferase
LISIAGSPAAFDAGPAGVVSPACYSALVPGPAVSVLVVSWQSAAWLERCLAAIDPAEAEIVVADNASTDGSAAVARTAAPHATVLALDRNLGFAGGVNAARRAARAPRLLLLNPDAAPTPGASGRLVEVLDSAADLGAVAGRLVGADGAPQHGFNVRRLPSMSALVADLLFIRHLWPGNPASARYYARDLDPDASADVEQPAAACLLVRADVFDRLGGFDEGFWPAWWEDVDFCRRLRDAGYRIRYVPDAVFRHEGGTSLGALGTPAFHRIFARNRRRYVRKHHGRAAAFVVGGLGLVNNGLRRLACAVSGRD